MISLGIGAALGLSLALSVGTFGLAPMMFASVMLSAGMAVGYGAGTIYALVKEREMNLFSSAAWSMSATGFGAVAGAALGTFVFPGLGTFFGSGIGALVGLVFGGLSSFVAHKLKDCFAAGDAEVVESSHSMGNAKHSSDLIMDKLLVQTNGATPDMPVTPPLSEAKSPEPAAGHSPFVFATDNVRPDSESPAQLNATTNPKI